MRIENEIHLCPIADENVMCLIVDENIIHLCLIVNKNVIYLCSIDYKNVIHFCWVEVSVNLEVAQLEGCRRFADHLKNLDQILKI